MKKVNMKDVYNRWVDITLELIEYGNKHGPAEGLKLYAKYRDELWELSVLVFDLTRIKGGLKKSDITKSLYNEITQMIYLMVMESGFRELLKVTSKVNN